ncbi:glycosyltransferase [Dorea sp. YH-dor228]|uniref:glycosyltransferase n=1 Tax=Dorea sp. YH-dor228 TaxID=3151120 RepID=UPI003242E5B5
MEISNKVSKVNTEPLISVVVPVYNIEVYLPHCLDSIMNQTYQNIEIVLVDDGSKDMSGQIADNYNVQYPGKFQVIHLENGGVTRARLTGVAAANGEWIGFVDGDDVIEPDMYRRLLRNALQYGADISHCGYQTIVNEGERVHYFYNTGRLVQQDRISGLKDLLSGSFVEPGLWNKLFRKTLFQSLLQTGTFDTSVKINEDLLMNYYLFKAANSAVYEDFCPYHYLVRSTSVTRSEFKAYKVLDPVKVCKWILEDAEQEIKDVAWRKFILACAGAYLALFSQKEYKEKCEEIRHSLIESRNKWQLLSRKERLKLKGILYMPVIYKCIYSFYEKTLQRKIYE